MLDQALHNMRLRLTMTANINGVVDQHPQEALRVIRCWLSQQEIELREAVARTQTEEE